MNKPTTEQAPSTSSALGEIRVERADPRHGDHEWNIFLRTGTECAPPDWKFYDNVDDCDTQEDAIAAALRLISARVQGGVL